MSTPTLSPEDRELLDAARLLPSGFKTILSRSVRTLAAASSASSVDPTALKLSGGKTYNLEERIHLEVSSLKRDFDRRRELLQKTIGTSKVCELLDLTPQAVRKRVGTQKLLAIRDGSDYRFPIEQFDRDAANGTVDALPEVLGAMQSSDFAKLNWLASPNPVFEGATPFDMLKRGEGERVILESYATNDR